MKKLSVTILVLSLVVVVGCGKDKKKKSTTQAAIGIINPQSCQPQVTNGIQLDQNMIMQISQQCQVFRQSNPQLVQQKMQYGQPLNFSAPIVQSPYGVNPYQTQYGTNPYQGGFYQNPYGAQQYPQQAGVGVYQLAGQVSFY